jgi:hypothetical protein
MTPKIISTVCGGRSVIKSNRNLAGYQPVQSTGLMVVATAPALDCGSRLGILFG